MTDWTKAMNPTSLIKTEAEATAAARASAIAIFLGVAWGLVGIIYIMTAGQAVMEAAMAQASAETPEMAGMAGPLTQFALWLSVGLVVIQLVIGLVQWAKPNIVIPIIFVILVAFGLVSGIFGLVMAGSPNMPETAATPMWQVVIGLIILVIQMVLHIAGIRGAAKLDKLRFEAAR
ncbi:hypothetical protein [Brevundimonas lenta]|uniref:Putative membrane protein n=1 Tax=Brevundimonas lenta TaxID=424796 RepID=A0A7W6NQR8_9CAUL|nr:hypothetical protein [Brevundimonas lenta]MBB4083477.1 putative membrane protein [Brevundimonas lenta]